MAHELFPTGAILTHGLGLGVDEGFLIAHFHSLFIGVDVIEPPVPPVINPGSGGSGPGPMPMVSDTNVPIQYQVILKVRGKNSTWEHTFLMSKTPAGITITVINLLNKTRAYISVSINNLKRVGPIKATISGLTRVATNAKVLINKVKR